jgi:acyl carrier protein
MSVEAFIKEKIEEITFTKVSDDDLLWTNKILDSITIIELVVELEGEYGIKIPMSDIVLENFEKVGLIANYIERSK